MLGRRWTVLAAVVAVGVGLTATPPAGATAARGGPRRAVAPGGPAADVSEELTPGSAAFLASAGGVDLAAAGYEQHEYVAAGTATSYRAVGALPTNGRFRVAPATTAPYRTRIVVRRPAKRSDFDGTVVVEWLNVSAGFDSDPDFTFAGSELVREGAAWVGVSAQRIGVEGGPVAVPIGPATSGLAGKGLKAIDPARYSSLSHPGDGYSYDIYTQVGRALRRGGALGGLRPRRLLAVGESQSAFALTTYVDGIQPRTKAYDGFLLHSRGGAPLPLTGAPGDPTAPVDITSAITGAPTIVRTDTAVPVLILETETDLVSIIGYYPARQRDTRRIRTWEVAGTAHADRSQVGPLAGQIDCGAPINAGPQRFAVRAAMRALDRWVRTGTPPRRASRIVITKVDGTPTITRDGDGLARGGIRTPQVDVPVDALSGEPGPSTQNQVICLLLGSAKPLSDGRIAELYGSRPAYVARYGRATKAAIASGFVLAADRSEILADAQPDRLPAGTP